MSALAHPGLALELGSAPSLRRRIHGWEGRLADLVEMARSRPYRLGQHDCFRFACGSVYALTGVELWEAWRGRYSSKLGALKLLAGYGGGFTASFSKLFQTETVKAELAQRGDVLQYNERRGAIVEPHLCVLVGAQAAGLAERGLYFVSREQCAHAWRIG